MTFGTTLVCIYIYMYKWTRLVNRITQHVTKANHERQKNASPNAYQKTPRRQKMKLKPGTSDGWGCKQPAFLPQTDSHIENWGRERERKNQQQQLKINTSFFFFGSTLQSRKNDEEQESRKLQLLSSS